MDSSQHERENEGRRSPRVGDNRDASGEGESSRERGRDREGSSTSSSRSRREASSRDRRSERRRSDHDHWPDADYWRYGYQQHNYRYAYDPRESYGPSRGQERFPPLPQYEPPPPPPLPQHDPAFERGQQGNIPAAAGSAFTLSKNTPPLREVASVGGTGRLQGLPNPHSESSSETLGRGVTSEVLSSVSHSTNHWRTAASLFVSQPQQPTPQPNAQGPSGQTMEKANLYFKKVPRAGRPAEEDLEASALFKSFGAAAVVQGVEDSSPRFALDPAQKASLASTLRTNEPSKLKATPSIRARKYPVHETSEDFLRVQELDPLFVKASMAKSAGLTPSDPLVISKSGEALDRQLQSTQKAIRTGLVAACSLQQGLGKLKGLMGEGQDPAVASALLTDIFEASQDVIDQMARASALQTYARRLQVLRSANLNGTEFQYPLLRLPLKDDWLFGEDIKGITEKCAAQKVVARCLAGARPKPPQQNHQPQPSHQSQQDGDKNRHRGGKGQHTKGQGGSKRKQNFRGPSNDSKRFRGNDQTKRA